VSSAVEDETGLGLDVIYPIPSSDNNSVHNVIVPANTPYPIREQATSSTSDSNYRRSGTPTLPPQQLPAAATATTRSLLVPTMMAGLSMLTPRLNINSEFLAANMTPTTPSSDSRQRKRNSYLKSRDHIFQIQFFVPPFLR
jgi:hypothetical protein